MKASIQRFLVGSASRHPYARGWHVDSYCNKHECYHLQNEFGGTDIRIPDYDLAVEAAEFLNRLPAPATSEEGADK